jgi:hypothetical protein
MPQINISVYLNAEDKKVYDANKNVLNPVVREFFKEKLNKHKQ